MRAWLDRLTGSGPVMPLLVLFGLNAVDELDRAAFAILAPEIRDEFGLGFQGLLALIAFVLAGALALQIPIAGLADRMNRVHLAMAGALMWAVFSFFTGVAGSIVFLGFMRSGSAIGKAVIDPTHNSLLSDYYPPDRRPGVFSFHRAGNAVGQIVGPLAAGFLGFAFGWRVPFLIFAVPTVLLVFAATRLHEPVRGHFERAEAGADAEAVATEEVPPSLTEAWRLCWKVETLRRIFAALPFLAVSLIGFATLGSLYYDEVFGLDERARGVIAAGVEPAQLLGLLVGGAIGLRLIRSGPEKVLELLAYSSVVSGVLAAAFALAPQLWMAIAVNAMIAFTLAILGPGVLAALSLAIPPRARAMGFSMGSLWVLPGLVTLPFIGWIADNWGIRLGMLVMVPVFVVGGLIIASARAVIGNDIEQVQASARARSEVALARERGEAKLLLCRDVQVSYDGVQVLFGVDIDIGEGEIVALLGTNGAGKSTLLKAISGVAEADRGAIMLDGRDITHAPPNEIAKLGIVQLPGGHAVFPSLTVAENIEAAQWLPLPEGATSVIPLGELLDMFPALQARWDDPAANLSGGQQQMLALAMTLISAPRVLMIDELSLGLAPSVVEGLLDVVRRVAAAGVTIILVEQSVNVALTVAERAYFMEKGQIRFSGPTAELLDRPDVLRSVFLHSVAPADPDGSTATRTAEVVRLPSDTTVLEVDGISRSFGGIRAVSDVSLAVGANSILGVIGPNGAGKTTMFDLISGFVPVDEGEVHLDGQNVTGLSAAARARAGLGRSFQDARLFPALTVTETIAVALERFTAARDPVSAALHLPRTYESEQQTTTRVAELIELMGLGAYRNKFIRELSTGTRRLVDLACVIAHRPLVVLLDEPSSGIAQREAEALAPVLRRIRDDMGSSLVVIEHDMPLLSAISDEFVALDQGSVLARGTPAEVLADPQVVASYLGSNEAAIARSGGP